jgi:hypothetical protein
MIIEVKHLLFLIVCLHNVFADYLVSDYSLLDYQHINGSRSRYKYRCQKNNITNHSKLDSIEVIVNNRTSLTFTKNSQYMQLLSGQPTQLRLRYKSGTDNTPGRVVNLDIFDSPILKTKTKNVYNIVFKDIKLNNCGEIETATVRIMQLKKVLSNKLIKKIDSKIVLECKNIKNYFISPIRL